MPFIKHAPIGGETGSCNPNGPCRTDFDPRSTPTPNLAVSTYKQMVDFVGGGTWQCYFGGKCSNLLSAGRQLNRQLQTISVLNDNQLVSVLKSVT